MEGISNDGGSACTHSVQHCVGQCTEESASIKCSAFFTMAAPGLGSTGLPPGGTQQQQQQQQGQPETLKSVSNAHRGYTDYSLEQFTICLG
jgi:hypothetical protein